MEGLQLMMVVFWCCAGALCNSTMAFSLGILQNYIYSGFQFHSLTEDGTGSLPGGGENVMHVYATTILMVGCGFCWTLGYIKLIISSLTFHVLSVVVMIVTTCTLKWWYYTVGGFAVYCVINGFVTGTLHVFFSDVLSKISESRVGLFNGLYGFCFGVSGIVANIIAATYINPHNVKPSNFSTSPVLDTGNSSWPAQYLYRTEKNYTDTSLIERTSNIWFIYATLFAVCYIPGIYFISCTNTNTTEEETTEENTEALTSPLIEEASQSMDYGTKLKSHVQLGLGDSFSTFFCSKQAYFYLSCTVSIGIASLVSSDLYKTYGMKVYSNDQFYNVAGLVVPIMGATGRVAWGTLYDILPEKLIFSVNSILVVGAMIGMSHSRHIPALYIFLVALVASSLGMMSCLAPAIKRRYTNCTFSLLLGLAMCGEVLGTAYYMVLTSVLSVYLSDTTALYLLSAPPAVSLLLCIVVL